MDLSAKVSEKSLKSRATHVATVAAAFADAVDKEPLSP